MKEMVYEIKTQNQMDGRKWDVVKTTNRLDVVKALGMPFTPKQARIQAEESPGKFLHYRRVVGVRVSFTGNILED